MEMLPPTVQIVLLYLGALGWIIGLIGVIIQVRSYLEQKRLEKGYEAILEHAINDWKGRYTEN